MPAPFRVRDGDAPGRDLGGWDENGNIDLPGTLTVDTIRGSGSNPAASTTTFTGQVSFQQAVDLVATVIAFVGAAATSDVITAKVDGDAENQFVINADGKIEWGGGTTAVDVNLFRDGSTRLHTVNTFVTEGDLVMDVAGGGLFIKEGTNARQGVATLTAGTVTVATTEVTATSRIFLTCQEPGGTPGFLHVSARNAGQDFTILSSDGADTSDVAWLMTEPAT